MKKQCRNCKHFDLVFDEEDDAGGPDQRDAWGNCRRFPPVAIESDADLEEDPFGLLEWGFPVIGAVQWCGEFAPAEP